MGQRSHNYRDVCRKFEETSQRNLRPALLSVYLIVWQNDTQDTREVEMEAHSLRQKAGWVYYRVSYTQIIQSIININTLHIMIFQQQNVEFDVNLIHLATTFIFFIAVRLEVNEYVL